MVKGSTRSKRRTASLPTREELLAFIAESPGAVGRREIARAFNIRGADRPAFRDMLKDLEGLAGRRRRHGPMSRLPKVTVVEVTGLDADGEPLARPLGWRGEGEPPPIVMLPEPRALPALAVGDRVLARLGPAGADRYEGRTIRRLPRQPGRVLGVYRRAGRDGRVVPTERRAKTEFTVARADSLEARHGELVIAESLSRRRAGLPEARVVERLGTSIAEPRTFSLIAIHTHEIPVEFTADALAEAAAAGPVSALGGRVDLRAQALVTIDGASARDFDDAVWAEADGTEGWHAIVAIADVAHYVRPASALDRAAHERGNSVYLPDRVVPMLPEELSNKLCSLEPGESRPCLAVHLWIDGDGRLARHRFVRAVIRSAARLTYDQVQAAHDGHPDDVTGPLAAPVIAPLYGAYHALRRARERRGALDLDLAEREVELDAEGRVASVGVRPRHDSHRLIEELMIAANVAAAKTLEGRRSPVMYRVHDEPAAEKVVELREFLATLGHKLPAGQRLRPAQFNGILRAVEGRPQAPAVNIAILRSQAKATYSPRNIGHFGLGLRRYSHFTSPIRRYADLLVHRSLIRGLGLGAGGLPDRAEDGFDAVGEHLSMTERRAVAAERDALDRFIAAFMAEHVGATFPGRVSGVARFGLFVALDETGAEGLVPRRSLGTDVAYDEARQELAGGGRVLRLGDAVEVRLSEADVATGGLIFEILSGGAEIAAPRARGGRKGRRGRAAARSPRDRRGT